jgi:sortase A
MEGREVWHAGRGPGARAAGTLAQMARVARIASIALITAGVFVLADVAATLLWREPVSSVYGAIQQNAAEDQLAELESGYPPAADRRAIAGVRNPRRRIRILARRLAARVGDGDAIGRIVAPAMGGLNAVMVEGTGTSSLQKGPGHYPQTLFPGEGGTVAIAGHRTTYLAPFRHIDSLGRGDAIRLEMPYATLVYRVQRTRIVDPSDVRVVRPAGHERLVLSACDPLYSAAHRFIVFARLARTRPARSPRPGG